MAIKHLYIPYQRKNAETKLDHYGAGLRELKLKATEAGEMTFSGYGSVFGNVDSYGDIIQKGAFAQCIGDIKTGKLDWPAMLSQHGGFTSSDNTPVGIWADLTEDEIGLKVEGKLASTPRGTELYQLMKMEPRPAIDGISIGYYAKDFEYGGKNDNYYRLLKRVELVEISLVTFPANNQARVQDVKSAPNSVREFQAKLQDLGYTRQQAITIINKGFKSLGFEDNQADVVDEKAVSAELLTHLAHIQQGLQRLNGV